ncbi:MAG: glutathione peroxidase [Pseudomonas sp.]|nr:glutathione peroxidase [Pseudomonas sp.]
MSDNKPELPNHLSINPRSPHFVEECFEHDIGIRFKGKERTDIEEYNISEGWVKISSPTTKDRFGRPLLIKLKGEVEAFYKCGAELVREL